MGVGSSYSCSYLHRLHFDMSQLNSTSSHPEQEDVLVERWEPPVAGQNKQRERGRGSEQDKKRANAQQAILIYCREKKKTSDHCQESKKTIDAVFGIYMPL